MMFLLDEFAPPETSKIQVNYFFECYFIIDKIYINNCQKQPKAYSDSGAKKHVEGSILFDSTFGLYC